jgi:DnaK suppressor protein
MAAAAGPDAAALPVWPGEDPWTADELAGVTETLTAEVAGLRAEITQAEAGIADRLRDSVGDAGDDQADLGAKTFEREHELALTHNARALLVQNEQALARISEGTYGTCESWRADRQGPPPGVPRATLCVTCKQREERR